MRLIIIKMILIIK